MGEAITTLEASQEEEPVGKWPDLLLIVRHAPSAYNIMKLEREQDPKYQQFRQLYKEHFTNPNNHAHVPVPCQLKTLALQMMHKYGLGYSNAETPLVPERRHTAVLTGQKLSERYPDPPDVILCSPYLRTHQTREALTEGWPQLGTVKVVEEERVREQDHGEASYYNDYRVYHCLHPLQYYLYHQNGPYRYSYPQGENVPDMRERMRSMVDTLIRSYKGQRVLIVTHHLALLALMANVLRWGETEFLDYDKTKKPINCGVTTFRQDPNQGTNGKAILQIYNECLY